jgi:hypothetical protein
MSTIEIRDIHEPERDLLIQELGNISGGQSMAAGGSVWPPVGRVDQMLPDAFSKIPDIFSQLPDYQGWPFSHPGPAIPAGPFPVEPDGGIGN